MTGWMFVVSSMLLVVLGSMLGFVIGLMVGLFIPTAEERKERLMPEPHSPQKPPPTDPLQEARRLSEWTVSALEYYKHDPSYCFTAGEARELADEVLALAQRVEDAEGARDGFAEAIIGIETRAQNAERENKRYRVLERVINRDTRALWEEALWQEGE